MRLTFEKAKTRK